MGERKIKEGWNFSLSIPFRKRKVIFRRCAWIKWDIVFVYEGLWNE